MTEMSEIKPSQAPEPRQPARTRAERLLSLVERVNPTAAQQYRDGQSWPNEHPSPGEKRDAEGNVMRTAEGAAIPARHSGAPYTITTLSDDRRRIELRSEDGDIVSGTGKTIEEAIASLETKLKVKE